MPTPCQTGSFVFGAVGKYVSYPASADWAPGTGDFCIEWWQYQTQATPPCCSRVWQIGNWPAQHFGVSIENGNFYAWMTNAIVGSYALTNYLNQWVHFAYVRKNLHMAVYQNGAKIIDGAVANMDINTSPEPLQIGYGSDMYWTGKLTNFHFVKGNSVYEPAGSTITVPTGPLNPTTGTKLLLRASTEATYLTDSSGLNRTATNNGNVTWSADSPLCPETGIVSNAATFKIGAQTVSKIYKASTLIWEAPAN